MGRFKKLTLIHSNDMHGDFMSEMVDSHLLGGVSMLSGYISKVRKSEENVIYAVAGDMLRGSVIDSEFKGLSTIEIMNMLTVDVASVGNHEFDYGTAHLLLIEKCARFPIVSANIYVKNRMAHLFRSHYIKKIDGMKILFIGISTEDILKMTPDGENISNFIDVRSAVDEIQKICSRYKSSDIDLTVLLTHIGFEEDKKLASLIEKENGVDLIIGGHSHTFLEKPCVINGIPIVQAVTGTDQIGRFDITVDTCNNKIHSYTWELIPITPENCPKDPALEEIITKYKSITDVKYSRYITRTSRVLKNESRKSESEVGMVFADALRDYFELDIVMIASGSLRSDMLGEIVEYGDLLEMFPFADELYRLTLNGRLFKKVIMHVFRKEALDGQHTEFYQYSGGVQITVSEKEKRVISILFNGKDIDDDMILTLGIQGYHYKNSEKCLGLTYDEMSQIKPCRLIAAKDNVIIDEYLSSQELIKAPTDKRWTVV